MVCVVIAVGAGVRLQPGARTRRARVRLRREAARADLQSDARLYPPAAVQNRRGTIHYSLL
jgi:hypothetical protein